MPAVVRARLGAGLMDHDEVLVDDGRTHRAPRPSGAWAVYVTEWAARRPTMRPGPRTPTIPTSSTRGVHPPAAQLARGSTAWLPLDCDAEDVAAAAHGVMRGLTVVSPSVLPAAGSVRERTPRREQPVDPPEPGDGEPHLTDRELEVLRALAEGLGNKQIGGRLGISPSTVKYHLQAIFAKLGGPHTERGGVVRAAGGGSSRSDRRHRAGGQPSGIGGSRRTVHHRTFRGSTHRSVPWTAHIHRRTCRVSPPPPCWSPPDCSPRHWPIHWPRKSRKPARRHRAAAHVHSTPLPGTTHRSPGRSGSLPRWATWR